MNEFGPRDIQELLESYGFVDEKSNKEMAESIKEDLRRAENPTAEELLKSITKVKEMAENDLKSIQKEGIGTYTIDEISKMKSLLVISAALEYMLKIQVAVDEEEGEPAPLSHDLTDLTKVMEDIFK